MPIILNGTRASLKLPEPGHPARLLLCDLSAAARRSVRKTSIPPQFSAGLQHGRMGHGRR
jgi:hypothetical protein